MQKIYPVRFLTRSTRLLTVTISSILLCFSSLPLAAQTSLTSFSPTRNAQRAPLPSNIALTFTQAIEAGTENKVRIFGSHRQGLRTGSFSGGGTNAIEFNPALHFAPGEPVLVSIPNTVKDITGTSVRPALYQFTAEAGPGSAIFSGTTDLAGEGDPTSVAIADVNNDGQLDLVVASTARNYVVTHLGNGAGVFTNTILSQVGTSPQLLLLADVNNDSNLDLLTANAGSNTVSVHLGTGRGGFAGFTNIVVGSVPTSLVATDVNNDGKLDLLVTNSASNTVSILLGSGTGSFTNGTPVAVGTSPSSVTAGDINNDGLVDLLVANATSNTVSIRLGNGTGVFSGISEVSTGNQPRCVTTTDLNNDGHLDMLVANQASNTITAYLGTGTGTFSSLPEVVVGPGARYVVAADVDGDGNMDALTANAGANTVSVRRGDGAGGFTASPDIVVGNSPVSLAVGDLNGDAALDVITANATAASMSVRLNQGIPVIASFTPIKALPGAVVTLQGINFSGATSVSFAGLPSPSFRVISPTTITATIPSEAVPGPIAITTAVGTGLSVSALRVQFPVVSLAPTRSAQAVPRTDNISVTFAQLIAAGSESKVRLFASQRQGLRPGAYSGSGTSSIGFNPTLDFASGEQVLVSIPNTVTDAQNREALPYVYQFTVGVAPSAGTFTNAGDLATPRGTWNMVAGDVNEDGNQDIITGNLYDFSASVWLGDGRGGLTKTTTLPLSGSPANLVLADVNNDGRLDLIAPTGTRNIINVRLGNGQGSFSGSTDLVVFPARPINASDVNNDGNIDLISFGSSAIEIQLGDGQGKFTPSSISVTDVLFPGSSTVADTNNDGNLDFLVADRSSNGVFDTVKIFLGDGEGKFSQAGSVVVDRNPTKLVTADINQDGNLDILCANYNANTEGSISVRLGNGQGGFTGSSNLLIGVYPRDIDPIDVDGDGDIDFLTTGSDRNINICLNDGSGNFSSPIVYSLISGQYDSMVTTDLNNDGTLDFAVIEQELEIMKIRLNSARTVTALTSGVKPDQFTIYPNPSSLGHPVTLVAPDAADRVTMVQIVNSLGQIIYAETGKVHGEKILLPAHIFQAAGVYFIRVERASGTSHAKVVVQE